MKKLDYYILDVFARNKYEGNQLAVYIDLSNELDGEEMLKIAQEINFAESTFIKKRLQNNKYSVRIYTTESEIPFAGHPTIGTSYIIAKYLMSEPTDEIVLSLIDREIKVRLSNKNELDDSLFEMTQTQPEFLKVFQKEEISKQLEIEEFLISEKKPIQEISTGLPYIIIPIRDIESIEKIELKSSKLKEFLIKNEIYKTNNPNKLSTSLFFYTEETYEKENDYNVRMFCIEDNILKEDSATGSANGCFLAYLLKYTSNKVKAKIEQGFQMNRKSYLYLDGKIENNKYEIKVGGYSKIISRGEWMI